MHKPLWQIIVSFPFLKTAPDDSTYLIGDIDMRANEFYVYISAMSTRAFLRSLLYNCGFY